MKKLLALLLSCVLSFTMFACTETAGNESAESAESPSSSSSSAVDTDKPVTIHFFNAIIENVEWYEGVIEKFEAQYPNITVEMEFQKDYDSALKVKFQTGDVPEIINGGSTQLYIDQGRFVDLSDMEQWWSRMLPGVKDTCTDYKTGKQFFITTNTSSFGLLYNKAIFEELNLEVPKTLDEFISVLSAIKEAKPDVSPLHVGSKDAWMLGQMMDVWGYSPIREANGNVETKRAMIENDQSILGFGEPGSAPELFGDAILKLRDAGLLNSDFITATYDNSLEAFANGQAACLMQGLWTLSQINEKNPDFTEIGFAPLPALAEGDQPVVLNAPDVRYFIGAESEHPEEAKIFLDFLFNVENQTDFTVFRQSPTAFNDVDADWGPLKDDVDAAVNGAFVVDWSDAPIGFAPDDIGRMVQDLYAGTYADASEFAQKYAADFDTAWTNTYGG